MKNKSSFALNMIAFLLGILVAVALRMDHNQAGASQTYTADCYASSHVAATDLQNMENNFAALRSSFSGTSAPSNTTAGMWWYDTTNHILKLRNEADSAWYNVVNLASGYVYNCHNTVVQGSGIGVSGSLQSGNVTVSHTAHTGDVTGSTALTIAAGAVTQAKLPAYTAGDRPLITSLASTYAASSTYTKVKEISIDRPGTLRISFCLVDSGAGTSYARIYRNGSAVGTERAKDGSSSTYSEDISGWSAGDLVQIYAKNSSSSSTYTVSDMKIFTGNWYGLAVLKE